MSLLKRLKARSKRRVFKVRKKQLSRGEKPRVSVSRSLQHIYAQVIDDAQQKTVASFSSMNLTNAKGTKKEIAKLVGLELGKAMIAKKIENAFFDRGGYLYHGRVQAVAEGLREAGVKI